MRGKVFFWKISSDNPLGVPFGWGFIGVESARFSTTPENRVYFNERAAHYSPITVGDVVEFEIFPPKENSPHQSRSAFKVERVKNDVAQAQPA